MSNKTFNFSALRESELADEKSVIPDTDKSMLQVTFELPDESKLVHSFPVSQTVGYLKVHMERYFAQHTSEESASIPTPTLDDIELWDGEKQLADPYSLCDVGYKAGSEITLRIAYSDEYIQTVTDIVNREAAGEGVVVANDAPEAAGGDDVDVDENDDAGFDDE